MVKGHMISDVVAIIGTQDIVFGEIGQVNLMQDNKYNISSDNILKINKWLLKFQMVIQSQQ